MMKLKKMTPYLLSLFWVLLTLGTVNEQGFLWKKLHHFFIRMDYLAYDIKMLAWIKGSRSPPPSIVIVAIDDNSIEQEGQAGWPWPYEKIAALMAKLHAQDVSVIASDLIFPETEKNCASVVKNKWRSMHVYNPSFLKEIKQLEHQFDGNLRLIHQVKNKNNTVLSFLVYPTPHSQGRLSPPIALLNPHDLNKTPLLRMPGYIANFPALQNISAHNGFISIPTDEDGIVRKTPLVEHYQENVYPSLPLAVAAVLLPKKKIKINTVDIGGAQYVKSIQLGDRQISTDKNGQIWIPFYGKAHTFKYYSATDILKNKLNPGELKHAVVFLGATATRLRGFSNTSVDKTMPNIEIHATVLSGILENRFPQLPFWSPAVTIGLILVVGITLTLLLPRLSPFLSIAFAIFVFVLLITGNLLLWVAGSFMFSFSTPIIMTILLVLTNMICGFLFESRKKKLIREAFNQYVPPDYVRLLLENPDAYSLEGEPAELTVLFADIRHFTTISESLDASSVKKLLNQYFTPMTRIIFEHKGTIDKYVGDMIMAFWGAPIKNMLHREAAIDAALDMLTQSEALKTDFRAQNLPEVNIGIGINTGLMNVGDMGSEYRRSYTVLGDPVNLGARLESATKYYGVNLIVGSATRAGQTKFVFRLLDKVAVQGKHVAVDIYEVVCREKDASPALLQEIEAHQEALSAYFRAEWSLSHRLFKALAEQHPHMIVYQLFLDRIVFFEKNPPPPDWDGSYEHLEK